jgi:sugar/nucleoside kinase (ribokinase family)
VGIGARQAARYAGALAERFPLLAAVVTNGAEPLGSAFHGDVRAHTPLRARVRAVNGAGDSLAAGTIRGLAEGMALAEAVRFGLGAAALTLEAGGILEAAFTADAVAERMAGGSPSGPE